MRYADDFIVGFEHQVDADQFLSALRERLAGFALQLHPEKTRLIEFGRFAATRRAERGLSKPATFDFLGFTHICGRSRQGRFLLARHTIGKRLRAKLQDVKAGLQRRMHRPVREQGRWLGQVVRGYFAYHAVPTNVMALGRFLTEVHRHWHRMLRRRSQRDRTTWERMKVLTQRWIPPAKITHPWPEQRFDVMTRGKSPVR